MVDIKPLYSDAMAPVVSIIVLNFNKSEMTIACLESIWENTSGASYEVLVVDNGSEQEDYSSLYSYKGPYKLIRLEVNRFFGEGNNIGAEAARGEYIVFLNNDVIVTKRWLEPLLETIRTNNSIGCCGPKFLYPSGELQEAGALLDENGDSIQIGKFQSPDQPRFNCARDVDYISAACVIMRKRDFDAVLGFDFRYEPAYYEDCDLCLKIGALGKTVRYVATSAVIHHENATTSDFFPNLQLSTVVALNKVKFVSRWKHFLENGRHDDRQFVGRLVPPNALSSARRAGFYTPYNIITSGRDRYLLEVMEAFSSMGFALTLIVPERFSRVRISAVLKSLDLELPSFDIVTYAEAANQAPFDVFFCVGNEIYPTSPGLGMRNIYFCQVPFKSEACRFPWLDSYVAVVCCSEFVQEFIRANLAGTIHEQMDVRVLYPSAGLLSGNARAGKTGILAIGRFFVGGHCKRQDMLIEAFRELIARGNNVELHLVGALQSGPEHRAYLSRCMEKVEGLPVHFHLDAPPEELTALLAKSSVYWHGAGYGVDPALRPDQCEHLGTSVLEAMSARLVPLVVSNGGPASIVEHGVSGYHYADCGELVSMTEMVLNLGRREIEALRESAFHRAQQFSHAAFRERWISFVNDILHGDSALTLPLRANPD